MKETTLSKTKYLLYMMAILLGYVTALCANGDQRRGPGDTSVADALATVAAEQRIRVVAPHAAADIKLTGKSGESMLKEIASKIGATKIV